MTLAEHLEELRTRIIRLLIGLGVAMAAALLMGGYVVNLLKTPYVRAMAGAGRPAELAVLSVSAGLVTYLRVSLITAVVLAAPWIFYQLWMFVAAGLYPRERRVVKFAVPMSAGLFVAGVVFFVFVVATPVMTFFIRINEKLGLASVITFDNHVDFMVTMSLVFALAFQTPLILLLLGKMGLVTASALARYRRHAIVGIFALAAVLTPPDVLSQICLALPLWGLYELGILLVWLFAGRGEARQA